jgi:hypothetical protein
MGAGLSTIRASPTRNGLDDLDLFAVVTDDQMTDVDDALVAGVGALKAGVMRLNSVVGILSRWVRMGWLDSVVSTVNLQVLWAGPREILGGLSAGPFLYVQVLSHNGLASARLTPYNAQNPRRGRMGTC